MKKERSKKTTYILALAVVIVTGSVLFFINAFYGNPLSQSLAERAADSYIKEHYGQLDLERGMTDYNSKNGTYVIPLQEKGSPDSAFEIAFDHRGRFFYDTYEDRLWNTYDRFSNALRAYGKEIERRERPGFELDLSPDERDDYEDVLRLDQPVDLDHFPLDVEVRVHAYAEVPNFILAMDRLQEAQRITDGTGLNVTCFSILLIPEADRREDEAISWENAVTVFGVPEDVVRQGDMDRLKYLEAHPPESH